MENEENSQKPQPESENHQTPSQPQVIQPAVPSPTPQEIQPASEGYQSQPHSTISQTPTQPIISTVQEFNNQPYEKKSSRKKKAILIIAVCLFALVLASLTTLYFIGKNLDVKKSNNNKSQANVYTFKDDNFRIQFPQQPTVTDGPNSTYNGATTTSKHYSVGSNDTKKYEVAVIKVANGAIADWNKFDTKTVQNMLLDSSNQLTSGVTYSKKNNTYLTFQNHLALLTELDTPNKVTFALLFFDKSTQYIIYEGGLTFSQSDFMNFANTFSFISQ
jgi:hypothetical protein